MTLRYVSRALFFGLVLALIVSQGASSAVRNIGEASVQYFLCDADASHPRKAVVYQTIREDYSDRASLFLIADYGRTYTWDAGEGPTDGTVKTTIHVLRDGKWKRVGRIRATLYNDHQEGEAETGKWIAVSLEPGDTLRWTFSFTKFPAMVTRDWFSVGGEVIAELP